MIMVFGVFMFVRIVDAKQRSCEGSDLSKSDEERLMDLSLGYDEDSTEEENHAPEGEQCGCDELYVDVLFHGVFRLTVQK